jgi:hypothetical protein
MNVVFFIRTWPCIAAIGLVAVNPLRADAPRLNERAVTAEQLRPRWHAGDQWTIESTTMQLQIGGGKQEVGRGRPITWQFRVAGTEKLGGRDCWRVEVRPLVPGRNQPVTTFWVDRESMAMQQFQSQVTVAGGLRTMTESYQFSSGQPAPVQGPLTALPIDLPLFAGGQMKGAQQFTYEAVPGPAGQKAVGEMGFVMNVQQEIETAKPAQIKELLADEFAKDLQTKTTVEVRLKSPQGRVRQLWQPGAPWPVYTDNGPTVARLVKYTPAAPSPHSSEVQP